MRYAHNNAHKALQMRYKGQDIEVDRDMGEIMRKLWKAGVDTTSSCQADHFVISPVDPKPLAYVGFPSIDMVVKFLRLSTEIPITADSLTRELEKKENTNQIGIMRVALSNGMVVFHAPNSDYRVYFSPDEISSVEYALPWQ